jgi:hypothetical protein
MGAFAPVSQKATSNIVGVDSKERRVIRTQGMCYVLDQVLESYVSYFDTNLSWTRVCIFLN